MTDIVLQASRFAEVAHAAVGQKRKYTGEPYIVHPRAVARIVMGYLHLPTFPNIFNSVIAAALLHDVVEDTQVPLSLIAVNFPPLVATLVEEVTDLSTPADGNRRDRKAIDRAHLEQASPLGKVIKLADLIDNTRTIVKYDKAFAKIYLTEKRLLLDGPLLGSASQALYARAVRTLEEGERDLQCG